MVFPKITWLYVESFFNSTTMVRRSQKDNSPLRPLLIVTYETQNKWKIQSNFKLLLHPFLCVIFGACMNILVIVKVRIYFLINDNIGLPIYVDYQNYDDLHIWAYNPIFFEHKPFWVQHALHQCHDSTFFLWFLKNCINPWIA